MPGDVPNGWRRQPLGNLGQFLKCRGGSKKDEVPTGVPVVRYGQLYTQYETVIREFFSFVSPDRAGDYTPLKYGDVLFAGSGETLEEIGKAAVFLGDGAAHGSGDLILLRPSAAVDPLFLGYCANGGEANAQKLRLGQGSSVFHISADRLAGLQVATPPLPEQKKIAAILSSVDEAMQATLLVIDQTRRVKEGLLQDLLTRGLPGHTRFKQTEIGEIPESWEVRRLGDIASVERGKFSHRPRNAPHLYGGRHPFVQTGDIGAADDLLVSHSQTLNDEGLTYSRTFPAGTILITIAANIGDVALTTYPVSCPDSLVGIIPHSDDALWLLYALAARKDRLDRHAPESAQKNINLQTLVPLPIAVPPRREQEGIRDAIQSVADAIRVEEERLRVLSRLKAGLLQDLLSGKVRVSP